MTNETTDNTDEPSKAELHDRVRELESTVEKLMPSRRDVLGMGAAGLVGAAGLSATTQTADASTGSAGRIGSSSDRPTIFADDIDANSLTGSVKNRGCRVFLSSQQSLTAGSRAKIQFDASEYDSDNNFDLNTHNWTCPEDGIYIANLHVTFRGGGSGQQRRVIIGSGASSASSGEGAFHSKSVTQSSVSVSVSTVNKYAGGDTIAAYCSNTNASDAIGPGNENFETFFEVAFLGGL